MKIGELFSGYGGLGMGVQAVLGGDIAWHSEIDPGACKILAHRYPDVPNLGDITAVDWSQVEPVDVITGGSPCQDVSAAGKRAGMRAGTRSGLWASMCDAIDIIRPSLVVWENVRGVLSAHADSAVEPCPICVGDERDAHLRALGRVVGDLSELGYVGQWVGLRAADVGAAHGRFRVFITAQPAADPGGEAGPLGSGSAPGPAGRRGLRARPHDGDPSPVADPDGDALREQPVPLAGCGCPSVAGLPGVHPAAHTSGDGRHEGWTEPARLIGGPDAAERGDAAAHAHGAGSEACSGRLRPGDPRRPQPVVGRGTTDTGEATASGDLRGVWDERAAACASRGPGSHKQPPVEPGDAVRVMSPAAALAGGPSEADGSRTAWGPYEAAIRRWEGVLGRPAPSPTEPGKNGQPRLSPVFVEFLMGLPDGWVTDVPGITRNEALKALGNGVVPQQAAAGLRLLLTGESAVPAADGTLLPTPSVADAMGGHLTRSGSRSNELLLPGIAKQLADGAA